MTQITNSMNNQIGGSLSGVTNTLTVTNPSNTSSSSALVQVTVGGSSAGNPFTTYTVTGVSSFSQGINNSVSGGPFQIAASTALGTTNVATVNTSGYWNFPLQPAFLYYLASNDANATGNNAVYTLGTNVALTKVYDVGSNMTTGGTFTAPIAGNYHFDFSVTLTNCTIATSISASILANGITYTNAFSRVASANNLVAKISCLAAMTASSTAVFKVTAGGEAGNTDSVSGSATLVTFMCGYLAN